MINYLLNPYLIIHNINYFNILRLNQKTQVPLNISIIHKNTYPYYIKSIDNLVLILKLNHMLLWHHDIISFRIINFLYYCTPKNILDSF